MAARELALSTLSDLQRRLHEARLEVRLAETARDTAMVTARQAGSSLQELADAAAVSTQRVSQIVDGAGTGRPKLHAAMKLVLARDAGPDGWMPAHAIARTIDEEQLYHRRDGTMLPPAQVRARAAKYPHMFETTNDGTGRVRLLDG